MYNLKTKTDLKKGKKVEGWKDLNRIRDERGWKDNEPKQDCMDKSHTEVYYLII